MVDQIDAAVGKAGSVTLSGAPFDRRTPRGDYAFGAHIVVRLDGDDRAKSLLRQKPRENASTGADIGGVALSGGAVEQRDNRAHRVG